MIPISFSSSVLNRARFTAALLLVILLGACASTRPVVEWRDEQYSGAMKSLLVIAATDDGALRRFAEDAFRDRFESMGLTVITGYRLLGESTEVTRESVAKALGVRDLDGVLVTRLLGVEEVEQYQPPTQVHHYRSYPRYYAHAMTVTTPGYYRRFKLVTLETALYDRRSGQLVWSMQSETMAPEAPQDVVEAQINLSARRLDASGLLVTTTQ